MRSGLRDYRSLRKIPIQTFLPSNRVATFQLLKIIYGRQVLLLNCYFSWCQAHHLSTFPFYLRLGRWV